MDLFSPLSKDYCLYFYLLSIFAFVLIILNVLMFGWNLYKKKMGSEYVMKSIFGILGVFIIYFQNRLLYSMCVK